MSCKELRFKVAINSKAEKVIEGLFNEYSEYLDWRKGLPDRLGVPKDIPENKKMIAWSSGLPAGFYFGKNPPPNFKQVKNFSSYWYPYARNKDVKAILKEKTAIRRNEELAKRLFGNCPMVIVPHGSGMAMRTGASLKKLGENNYVTIPVEKEELKPIVSGMRKIKESSYVAIKEKHPEPEE